VSGELEGKVVLLTGASGGIGSVTARALGTRGAAVVAHYGANRVGAEAAVEEIPADRRLLVQADLRAAGSARTLFAEVKPIIDAITKIGIDDSDEAFIAHLRAIPVSLASQSFPEVWDSAMADERLSEEVKESLMVQTLELQELDLRAEGLLFLRGEA